MSEDISQLEKKLDELNSRGVESSSKVDLLNQLAENLTIDEPNRALDFLKEAKVLAEKLNYKRGIGFAYGLAGFAHYMLSDFEAALTDYLRALPYVDEADELEAKARIFGGLGSVQLSLGDYEQALANELKSLNLIQKLDNKYFEAWSHNNLGVAHYESGDFERALKHHRQSLKLFTEAGEIDARRRNVGRARALTGIGTVFQSLGDHEKALDFHLESLDLYRTSQNKIGEARALNDLGIVYQNLGDLDKSLQLLQESLEIRRDIGNKLSECTSLINLGKVYIKRNEISEALDVLHRALTLSMEIKAKPRIYQTHEVLTEAYEKLGEFDNALAHYKMYHDVRQQVSGDEAKAKLKNLQVSFEVERTEKEAEITRLKNVELRKKNKQLKELLDELKAAQNQLVQSEKMAALGLLVAGLVHEVNSPLGVVQSSADILERSLNKLVIEFDKSDGVTGFRNNGNISRILDLLEQNNKNIQEAEKRIGKIVRSLKSFARLDEADFQYADLHEGLDSTLTLIEHEAGENISIKKDYGDIPQIACFPGELNQVFMNILMNGIQAIDEKGSIKIRTYQKNQNVHVEISDTGVGIQPEKMKYLFDPGLTGKGSRVKVGLGLFSSYNIVQKHNGQIKVKSTPGKGSKFTIILPTVLKSSLIKHK